MARPVSERPTALELMILKILWDQSPIPVREIRDRLAEQGRDVAHTTVITTLNIMVRKRFVRRRKLKNAFLFSPCVARDEVATGFVGDVVKRVFDGSARDLMLAVLETSDVDEDELREIRKLISAKSKQMKEEG